MKKFRALRARIAKIGLFNTLWHATMSRLRPWVLFTRVYRKPIEEHINATLGERFDLHTPSREELDRAYAHFGKNLMRDSVEQALARGDVCMAAFDRDSDNRMVGFSWGARKTAPHGDGLWVEVEYPYLYGYKAYVDPEYRGLGINVALIVERDKTIAQEGYRSSVGFVETHNYASVHSNVRMGSQPAGYAGYIKLFGRAFPFRSPKARASTLRFYRPTHDVS